MNKWILFSFLILISIYYIGDFRFSTTNQKIINIYGGSKNLNPATVQAEDCVVQTVRIIGDSIFIDTCYATSEEVLQFFLHKRTKSTGINFKGNINQMHKRKKLSRASTFYKLTLIPTERLRQLERRIKSRRGDRNFGLEIEISEEGKLTLINIENSGASNLRFVQELFNAFAEEFD